MENNKVKWPTVNGKSLIEFIEYPIDTNFAANQFGNYVFAKFNNNNTCYAVYIGKGEIKQKVAEHMNFVVNSAHK
jgi:hypothetical protein